MYNRRYHCACVKCKNVKKLWMYVSVSVQYHCTLHCFSCDVYLCDLKVFELGWRSAARSGQAKLKTAKPSHWWEAVRRPIPRGEGKDLVWLTPIFIRKLKINHKTPLGICVYSWERENGTVRNTYCTSVLYVYTYNMFCMRDRNRQKEQVVI